MILDVDKILKTADEITATRHGPWVSLPSSDLQLRVTLEALCLHLNALLEAAAAPADPTT